VAKALTERGYSVWALDHRGHGNSDGPRAFVDSFEHAIADIHTLVEMVAAGAGGQRPFLLGHSMGGLLATGYTLRHQDSIEGLILSAPVAALESASAATRVISSLLSRVTPRLGVFGVDPSAISRDPDVVRDYEDDPLVFHGKLPVRTVAELAAEVASLPERVPSITLPVLLMYGTADTLAVPAGSVMLSERISSDDLTVTPYEGLRHEILNEPERDQVIAEIVAWLDSHRPRRI
jgi:alpha-beta hydrolase superfamily lysophospholipase